MPPPSGQVLRAEVQLHGSDTVELNQISAAGPPLGHHVFHRFRPSTPPTSLASPERQPGSPVNSDPCRDEAHRDVQPAAAHDLPCCAPLQDAPVSPAAQSSAPVQPPTAVASSSKTSAASLIPVNLVFPDLSKPTSASQLVSPVSSIRQHDVSRPRSPEATAAPGSSLGQAPMPFLTPRAVHNHSTITCPQPQCSFAQLVDPNEGTELKFMPIMNTNGIRCTQIEINDVEDEIHYWQSTVLCSVMGANPPFEIMKGFLNRIWANYEFDRILYVHKGVLLVRFAHLQDKISVEKRGLYFFDSKPMIVKGWNSTMDLQTESIRSLPIWIQLPALDIKCWGSESLSKIGSLLGIPIKTDKFTKDKQAIRYARLLVEMPIERPFPEHVEFFNEVGVLISQIVTYEWVPSKCSDCAMLGHTEDVCKKKGAVRTEWRKKPQPPPTLRNGKAVRHPSNIASNRGSSSTKAHGYFYPGDTPGSLHPGLQRCLTQKAPHRLSRSTNCALQQLQCSK